VGSWTRVLNAVLDRPRARLDMPLLRTIFGVKRRPGVNGTPDPSPKLAVVIETPRWDPTLFKVHFGLLTLKAYTQGERVLRFDAVAHTTRQLGRGQTLDKFPTIVARLAAITERFCTTPDCLDIGFIPDGTLDQLPQPSQLAAVRVGGVDPNKPRTRATLAAVLALSPAPGGFTVTDLAAKVHTMTGHTDYTTRQAAYDLRKPRGKHLVDKPGRTRRHHVGDPPARTIAALLTLHDQVIGPIPAGVRSPRMGPKPAHRTQADRHYESLRIGMQALFTDLAITTSPRPA
jgi:hypothetical protein